MKISSMALVGLFIAGLTQPARADLPPPDGVKFVDYRFEVKNLDAFPDQVLIAYPWSLSNGAPTRELALIEPTKPLSVGRRSDAPKLYAMSTAAYGKWKAGHVPPENAYEDAAIEALVTSDKVVACNLAPSPQFELPASDDRSEITETLRAVTISPTVCELSADAPAPTKAKQPGGSCAGCAIGSKSDGSNWLTLGLLGLAALGLRRSPRR